MSSQVEPGPSRRPAVLMAVGLGWIGGHFTGPGPLPDQLLVAAAQPYRAQHSRISQSASPSLSARQRSERVGPADEVLPTLPTGGPRSDSGDDNRPDILGP